VKYTRVSGEHSQSGNPQQHSGVGCGSRGFVFRAEGGLFLLGGHFKGKPYIDRRGIYNDNVSSPCVSTTRPLRDQSYLMKEGVHPCGGGGGLTFDEERFFFFKEKLILGTGKKSRQLLPNRRGGVLAPVGALTMAELQMGSSG